MSPLPRHVQRMKLWRKDAESFVRDCFHPDTIDEWQLDVLRVLPKTPRIAMSACKGPGKSCVLAWCAWWILACHRDAQGIALSITADNLRDGLWKELASWYAACSWIQDAFTFNAERIASRERPKTWWLSARSFAKDADKTAQANTIAGLHAKVVFVLLDEIGDYPEGVVVAAEGIFANEGQAWILAAGNPTSVDGPLYRIAERDSSRWHVIRITGDPEDPRRSPRISVKWAEDHIARWGRDNPWVRVNVLGLFPLVGSNKLLGPDQVMAAQERGLPALSYVSDPVVWGVDPARYGDDEACLVRRQGVNAKPPVLFWRNKDGPELATEIAKEILEAEKHDRDNPSESHHAPDAIFIDVGGNGSSCFDHLRLLGWDHVLRGIEFGSAPSDPRFADKRSEMWWEMAEWLKHRPSCLPKDSELQSQLLAPDIEYKVRNKRACLCLETKDQLRARGVGSPDRADALALTFAAPVARLSKRDVQRMYAAGGHAVAEYDPLSGGA